MLALLNVTSLVASSGYAAIFVLSVAQSCCVPTSSELTLGFAGVLAAEGKLSLPGVIVVGAAGELVGALVAWVIGRSAGRAVVDRWGKYILLSHRDLDRVEDWYDRHRRWGVFGSRLLPVIRNFVALPAGIAEVPILRFGVLTLLGSAIWDAAMALIGYEVGHRWRTVMNGVGDAGYVLAALVVIAVVVFIWHRYRSYRAATAGAAVARGRHLAGPATRPSSSSAGPATSPSGPGRVSQSTVRIVEPSADPAPAIGGGGTAGRANGDPAGGHANGHPAGGPAGPWDAGPARPRPPA